MPAPSSSRRQKAERAGRLAETAAMIWLLLKGYRIRAQRFVAPGGEIDLVAEKGGTLVFVEVKFRGSLEEARLAVTSGNQRRIKSAANTWLAQRSRRLDVSLRYDIIAASPFRVHHIRDAFR